MKLIQWLIKILFQSKNRKQEEYVRTILFSLIKQRKGEITVLDLAMEAKISGTEAKTYLDQFAKEFDANFEVDDEGCVVYKFPFKQNQSIKYNTNQNLSNRKQNNDNINTLTTKKQTFKPTKINLKTTSNFKNNLKSNNQQRPEQNININSKQKQKQNEQQKDRKNSNIEFEKSFSDINKEIKNEVNNIRQSLYDIFNNKSF